MAWHPDVPKRMLHVFSGPGGRADGLRRFMWDVHQCEVVKFDTLVDELGCDLLSDDDVFADLMKRIRAGEFFSAIIGTPCSTFSVARIPKNWVYDGGPRQLRDIKRLGRGRTNLNLSDQRKLDLSNILVERSVLIARTRRLSRAPRVTDIVARGQVSGSDR